MNSKHIVFLDMNKTSSGIEYFRGAKNLGLYVTFASFDPQYYLKPGEQIETSILRYADHILTVDTHHDMDGLIQTLRDYGEVHPIDGIIASLDLEILQAAIAAEQLGLPGTPPSAVRICRNKFEMRRKLTELNIPTPQFALVDSVEEALEAGKRIGYPCVLKPLDTTGSEGVQMIAKPGDFEEPLRSHRENLMYWRGVQKAPQMLVEEYMEGPLISVETVSCGGDIHVLGITDRIVSDPPYFAELFGSFPAEPEGAEEAIRTTTETLKAIGYDFGPAHTELIVSKSGPRIVEINPRLVGATVSLLMNKVLGYSIHEEILKMHVGLPVSFKTSPKGVGVFQQIVSPKSGWIKELSGMEEIYKVPGVMEFSIDKKEGDFVTSRPQKNLDALGHITVVGESRQQAVERANEAISKLTIAVSEGV